MERSKFFKIILAVFALSAIIVPSTNALPIMPSPITSVFLNANNLPSIASSQTRIKIPKRKLSNQTLNLTAATPLTFGQVFAAGDVPRGYHVIAKTEAGDAVPIQADVKAFHNDGSLRFAVISTILNSRSSPYLNFYSEKDESSVPSNMVPSTSQLSNFIRSGFNAQVVAIIKGTTYSANLSGARLNAPIMQWLDGSVVSEWAYKVPFLDQNGIEHPLLTARFHVRKYIGVDNVRVDVTVENTKAFAKTISNIVYDSKVLINGKIVGEKNAITHYHHARWRKVFWSNDIVNVDVKHDIAYMTASKALPNYDLAQLPTEKGLANLYQRWTKSQTDPMQLGLVLPNMLATGGREDIGPETNWASLYLLSMDKRAKEVALGTGELAGSYPIYYRDEVTDYPVSFQQYPDITTGNAFSKPLLSKCTSDCVIPHTFDTAHTPSFSYVPYLVTGDYFFLETLQFLVNARILELIPALDYRDGAKGLFWRQQIRGQAWLLRDLGRAAAFTPEQHPLKNYFQSILSNNLKSYDSLLINDVNNKVHLVTRNYAFGYLNGLGVAPWMDDFFTWSIGNLVELGFDETNPTTNAKPLLKWKAKYQIDRMLDPEFCWLFASSYNLIARDNPKSVIGEPSYMFTTMGEIYRHTFPAELTSQPCNSQAMIDVSAKLEIRDNFLNSMKGYPEVPYGYPSNMQPALAVIATPEIPKGLEAWQRFDSRSKKPDYRDYPVWNIIPRR